MDVGVRDRDDAGVGGDGDLVVGGAQQLALEGAAAVVLAAGAHARPAADEAAEVLRLDERALGAGRGDLERVALPDLAEVPGDALAQTERHAVGMVDEQPDLLAAHHLGEQHLDIGLGRREKGLDAGLHAAHDVSSFPEGKKKAGREPASRTGPVGRL
jgi:hypothetical protein